MQEPHCEGHAYIKVSKLSPLTDGDVEEINKPGKGVLVHWVNVGKISCGEEQHRSMGSYRLVACP